MRRKYLLPVTVILLFVSSACYGQTWSGILDPSRAVDWSTAGVPGGIPTNRTQCGSTITATGSDQTSQIQTALNGCGSGHYVLLGAGTFRINSYLVIPSNVTLRGSGPNQTTLDTHGSSSAAIYFGSTTSSDPTSGQKTFTASKGATQIVVNNTSGISVGTMLVLTQADLSYMTTTGTGGSCSWCNLGQAGASGQTVRVTNIAGTTLTISDPLYIDYTNSAVAYPFTATGVSAGLESLKVYANNSGYTVVEQMWGTWGCWALNVENDFADNAHFFIYEGAHNEVRDSYFHDGYNHGPGGTDNQLTLGRKGSANLVINNIFYRQHVGVMLEWGASGNVVAYNYLTGNYHQSMLTWMINDSDWSHGAHNLMNLGEGNIGDKLMIDDYWGSESHTTLFRNYYTGSRQYIPPMNARGALQTGSAQWEDSNAMGITVDSLVRYTNLVGNVVGSSHQSTLNPTAWRLAPAASGGSPSCFRFGYKNADDSAGGTLAYSTAFLHGNYDCRAGTFSWDAGHADHTLPASFFLASKPSWWGSGKWPPIGPDVSSGNSYQGYVDKIPAQLCFEHSSKDATGRPIFDADTCYKSSGGSGNVAAPTNLTVIVN